MARGRRRDVPVEGSDRKLVKGSRVVGSVHEGERVRLSLRLRRKQDGFDAYADQLLETPPRDRKALTRAAFAKRFGADPADVARVEAFARSEGLSIVESSAARRTIVVEGSAADLQRIFQVELKHYDSPRGPYRGRTGPVHVPAALEPIIEGVFGLDNRRQARPRSIIVDPAASPARAAQLRPFTPVELGRLYDFPSGTDGAGQTIGIIEFGGGFTQADLDHYFTSLGLPKRKITTVSVDGVANSPGSEADGEVVLDIEIAGALAPKAKIVVYFAPFTEQGWVDVLSRAVHDDVNKPSVLSISWGWSEGKDVWTRAAVDAVNASLKEAAALNVTVCVASGDDGSADDQTDGKVHVDFPAASPYALACGGTTLIAAGGTIKSEIVWNDGPRATAGGATGGGVSEMFGMPQWQATAKIPISVKTKRLGRGVPDVSGVADPETGYRIRLHGREQISGGTSAVAPLWAALVARMNQKLKKPVGFINPTLYSMGTGVFRDIVVGSNDTDGTYRAYPAGKGWDACTGLGSPKGTTLLAKL